MTLPALTVVLFHLASTATPLQGGTVLDIASLFPAFELRVAASILVTVAVVAAQRLDTRLHGKGLETASMPVWHPSMIVLRLIVVADDGGLVLVLWSPSSDIGTISAQHNLGRKTLVHITLSAVFVVGVYVLTSVLDRFIGEIASTCLEISDHQHEIICHIAQVMIYLTTLAVILGIWRADLDSFLVGVGFLGIVVGMVARQTPGSLIVGFIIILLRPSEISDWVEIGDREKVATEITVVNMRIQTFDGEFAIVPNGIVSSENLANRSQKGQLRLDIEVGVNYDADIDHAAGVVQAAVEGLDEVLLVPKPQVIAKRFGDSMVVLGVRPWVDRPDARRRWRARAATISAVSEAFDEEEIAIPFPQRTPPKHGPSGPISFTGQRPGASPEADGGVEGGGERPTSPSAVG